MSTWSVEARLAVGLTIVGLGLMSAKAVLAQGVTPPGPPQFLSAPLRAPEQIQQRIQGWLTFAVNQGKPSAGDPAAPEPASASFAGLSQSGSAPVDTLGANTTYQGEPAITVTPDNLLVGGYNSIDPGKCSATLANCAPGATVADASTSAWFTSRIPIAGNLLGFDPSTAADSANKVYYSYGVCSGSCTTGNLMVAVSDSSLLRGHSATAWTGSRVTAPQSGVFDDKPWIAADPAKAGLVYVAWDRNQSNNQTIYVTRTNKSNGAYSVANGWSQRVKVNDGTSPFERVIYAMPAVADDASNNSSGCGTVYLVWMDYARKGLYVDKSTNCGATWGTDKKVASLNVTFKDIGCNGGRSMTPAPYIAVDDDYPQKVYVTYADDKGAGTGMDVYIVFSTNGGGTWYGPYKVNDDGSATHQYNPAMSVADGKVHVSWLDRRDDAKNCTTETYATVSSSVFFAGSKPSFSPNYPLNPGAHSNFDGNPNGPGDYTGSTAYDMSGVPYGQPLFPTHLGTDVGSFEVYSAQITP